MPTAQSVAPHRGGADYLRGFGSGRGSFLLGLTSGTGGGTASLTIGFPGGRPPLAERCELLLGELDEGDLLDLFRSVGLGTFLLDNFDLGHLGQVQVAGSDGRADECVGSGVGIDIDPLDCRGALLRARTQLEVGATVDGREQLFDASDGGVLGGELLDGIEALDAVDLRALVKEEDKLTERETGEDGRCERSVGHLTYPLS